MNLKILLIPIWEKSSSFKLIYCFVLSSEQFTGLEVETPPPPPPGANRVNTLYQKRKDNQQKEINEQTTTTIDKSKWVISLSTYNITEDERQLLENGMNH